MNKTTKQTIIGPTVRVNFPRRKLFDVPAKVDTGADTSSVWASEIVEKEGSLEFKLFDKGCKWFNGETISIKKYWVRSVKNSFGVSQLRYKVYLTVEINGRKVRTRFTLSDRSNNRYPILVGRNTLKNKFIVDVNKKDESFIRPRKVAVFVRSGGSKIFKEFSGLDKIRPELSFEFIKYGNTMFHIGQSFKIKNVDTLSSLHEFDMFYFLTRMPGDTEEAALAAIYASTKAITFIDRAAHSLDVDSKIHQSAVLYRERVLVPETIYMRMDKWISRYDYVKEHLGDKFILKDNKGLKGRNNYLINDKEEYYSAVNEAKAAGLQLIAQKYIESEGYYRLIVMGSRVKVAMFRSVDQDVSHKYSKNRDGMATLIDVSSLTGKVQTMAARATKALNLNVSGVDLMQEKNTGLWYCIEVNASPQLVGGQYVKEKMEALGNYLSMVRI
jgi:glutathione synthase/RimK-type ligase-like ATP-grasp enzyme